MDLGLKAICLDYKYINIRRLLQTSSSTFTIHSTKKLHTSVVSDQKEKKIRREGMPLFDFSEAKASMSML